MNSNNNENKSINESSTSVCTANGTIFFTGCFSMLVSKSNHSVIGDFIAVWVRPKRVEFHKLGSFHCKVILVDRSSTNYLAIAIFNQLNDSNCVQF